MPSKVYSAGWAYMPNFIKIGRAVSSPGQVEESSGIAGIHADREAEKEGLLA